MPSFRIPVALLLAALLPAACVAPQGGRGAMRRAPPLASFEVTAATPRPRHPAEHATKARDVPPVPLAPMPLAPGGGITLAALGAPVTVRLHWSAPQAVTAERFFVEVVERQPVGNRAIFSAYVRHSGMALTLPAISGRYAWRVFAVASAKARYAPSAWSEFGVDGGSTF